MQALWEVKCCSSETKPLGPSSMHNAEDHPGDDSWGRGKTLAMCEPSGERERVRKMMQTQKKGYSLLGISLGAIGIAWFCVTVQVMFCGSNNDHSSSGVYMGNKQTAPAPQNCIFLM